jgi:integrase
MARKLPPHCEQWFDRHGRRRVYFRLGKGKRTPMPEDASSDEFKVAYAEALGGAIVARKEGRDRPKEGTLGTLILSYQKSLDYHDLRDTTKTGYQSRLNILTKQHGHRSVSGLTVERIEDKILSPFKDKPGQRLAILKMLRILIQHAIKKKWLLADPSKGIKRPKSGSIRSWTEDEIAKFEARWPIGTRERLGFALMLFTGQRRSDAHRMTWADTTAWTIRIVQQKTGSKLSVPIHRDLRKVLDLTSREHVTILITAYGRSFTVDGFSQFMRDAIKGAGLPLECQPHGLRKAAGRRLAEAGCSAKEIMSILGHKTMSEAQKYIDDADQEQLAKAAISKLERDAFNRD